MALTPGSRLGPLYEVQAPLGAGGMGKVYKARDTRLDRTVAIKVLLARVADDPDLRQRFGREAKTTSSLNPRTSARGMALAAGTGHGQGKPKAPKRRWAHNSNQEGLLCDERCWQY